jgi:hypothetical protein
MAVIEMDTPVSATPLSVTTVMTVLLAGGFATVAFDLFGQAISPMAGYAKLAPVGLANGTIKALLGTKIAGGGYMLHMLVGLLAYPLGWLLIARPLADRITPWMPKLLVAVAYGIGLWVFALYVMAHLVVGMKPFLGFTGITWVALVGHVVYAVAFFGAWEWMRARLA